MPLSVDFCNACLFFFFLGGGGDKVICRNPGFTFQTFVQ